VAEAVAQLKGAKDLGKRLHEVASASGALGLNSHQPKQALAKLIEATDPKQKGKHAGAVNGQQAMKTGSDGRALGQDPVEAFEQPIVMLDTPSTAAWATEGSLMGFAGQDTSFTSQGDFHQTAARTYASVSGNTTSLFTYEGGIQAYAANGPVSLRAHTDALQIWADKDVTVISVNEEIRIQAQSKVELIGGQSKIVLEGGNVTFTCPGKFEVKSSTHNLLGGGSKAAALPALPDTRAKFFDQQVRAVNELTGDVIPGLPYKITTADGEVFFGVTDDDGKTQRVASIEAQRFTVEWGVLPPSEKA
jgi:type VI secretion system secreted protein VgrG